MKRYFLLVPCLVLLFTFIFGMAVSADDSKTVRVGIYENQPKIFTDDKGNASGFWPEILEYIASEENWTIVYVHGTWEQCLARLQNNEIDLMPDVAYTEGRASLYSFSSETVYTSWSGVYAREGTEIKSIIDLEGKTIAVLKGSVNVDGPEGIKTLTKAFDIDCTFTEADSYLRVFELVENGDADAGVASKDFANQHQVDFNLAKTDIIFQPSSLYFAFPRGADLTPYLTDRVDYQIKRLRADEDSIYYLSLEKWLGVKPIEKAAIPSWIIWLLAGIGGLALLLAGGSFILRSQVRARTKELREEITERRRTEEKFSTLVERGNDGIIMIQDGLVKFANPKMVEMTGFSLEEAIGKRFLEFVSPEYRTPIMESYQKRVAGEEVPNNYEIEILAKDSSRISVEINASRIEFEGRPADMAIVRDITERKRAEEALRKSEERFRAVFENARDGLLLADVESKKFDTGNETVCRMLGYSLEELKNLGVTDIHPEESLPHVMEEFEKQLQGETTLAMDLPVKRKDGSVFYADVNSSPVMIAGKSYLLGIFRDVTERKKMEETLKASEERLKILFEYAPDAYYLSNVEGYFIDGNRAAEALSGYGKDEVVGKNMLELNMLAPDSIPKAVASLSRNRKGEPTGPEEYTLIRKDGSQLFVEISTFPIAVQGQQLVLSIARDITERKKMAEQLILTDRLASVGELASGIAHELNNPLTGVIGLSQLLAQRDVPGDIKEDLNLVYSEAQRAAGVVKNLLTFARKHPPAKELTNINDVISKVLELRAYEEKVNNIKVINRLAPDLPEIMADYFQLQQVFLNIVINAEHFMLEEHGKGTLTITTQRAGGIVTASFADDGPGIPRENLGHIFDPFFTTKEVGKGTGLGLSICHGIISAHCGRIYAESEPGTGATFTVELPMRQEEK
jgi:PAS domain S-box-containing protein